MAPTRLPPAFVTVKERKCSKTILREACYHGNLMTQQFKGKAAEKAKRPFLDYPRLWAWRLEVPVYCVPPIT